jgi:hypothetical protein
MLAAVERKREREREREREIETPANLDLPNNHCSLLEETLAHSTQKLFKLTTLNNTQVLITH